MRPTWIAVLLLASIAAGCASTDTAAIPEQPPAAPDEAHATALTAEERSRLVMAVWKACPEANPCLKLTACADAEGMYEISPTMRLRDGIAERASADCNQAQERDPSCRSLLADAEYAQIYQQKMAKLHGCYSQCDFSRGLRRGSSAYQNALRRAVECEQNCETLWSPAEGDCKQAQAALAGFQGAVR